MDSISDIKRHWDAQAGKFGTHPQATFNDLLLKNREARLAAGWIKEGERVLDAGCGNGHTSLVMASVKAVHVTGVDYSKAMVEEAMRYKANVGNGLKGRCEFLQGDVLAIPFGPEAFDRVVSIRMLINLPEWNHKAAVLAEIRRVLKPGGELLLMEASLQGWEGLNRMRERFGLHSIPQPQYNSYLDEERLRETCSAGWKWPARSAVASTYYFGSRVLYPWFLKFFPGNVEPRFNSWMNRFLIRLPNVGQFGTEVLLTGIKM